MRANRALPTILVLALAAAPAFAASLPGSRGHWGAENALRFQLGGFEPRGDSGYWDGKRIDFTGDADDLSDLAAGIEYQRFLNQHLGFVASSTFFTSETDQSYLDFVDEDGFLIFHTTELEVTTLTVGLVANLARRDRVIIPYVGAGGGFYFWRLSEFGDFIDFGLFDLGIFNDFFEEDGAELGWYWQAGLEVPLAPNLSVFGDARWVRAEADLGGDFLGLGDLDLSGRTLSAGVTWSF